MSDEVAPGTTLPCVVCDKELEPVFKGASNHPITNQPYAGTIFTSHGQYGSTVFDEMSGGTFLELNVCDPCLVRLAGEGKVILGSPIVHREVAYGYWQPGDPDGPDEP